MDMAIVEVVLQDVLEVVPASGESSIRASVMIVCRLSGSS